MNPFVAELKQHVDLTSDEEILLREANLLTMDELLAFSWQFWRLARTFDVDFPKLSAVARREGNSGFLAAAAQEDTDPDTGGPLIAHFPFGAKDPPNAGTPIGHILPNNAPGTPTTTAPPGAEVDRGIFGWSIRNQGRRGTCVAFAAAACRERVAFESGESVDEFDLSEEYVYWATKTMVGDPKPREDGTLLKYARDALHQYGACDMEDWPYEIHFDPLRITREDLPHRPSQPLQDKAKTRKAGPAEYEVCRPNRGGAEKVRSALERHDTVVAITVPVFALPGDSRGDNWHWYPAKYWGLVADPIRSQVAVGGHAICVTAFAPDARANGGGWFVFRNSWGSNWGHTPRADLPSREPGYGLISHGYVEAHLYELYCIQR